MFHNTPASHPSTLAAVCPLLVALTATGCAALPYHLTNSRDTIVAIDVALEPDPVLANRAGTGKSHISLVRGFVRSSDLQHVSALVAQVMATTNLEELNLKATGYRTGSWNGIEGTAMALEDSPALRRLEERMVEAVKQLALNAETAESFIVTPDGSRMTGEAIRAVERFVPDSSGVKFRPHAVVAAGQVETAKRLESQPFEPFTFKPVGAVVYQVGRLGVAERMLWSWTGEPGARQP
jgi:hypothetical protein